MAAHETLLIGVRKSTLGFKDVLSSALCEWLVIFLLLVESVSSYLARKVASYCKLPVPCIFCTRLHHVVGNKSPGFYQNLLCRNHISEISSLISCHVHGKLVDSRGMCDGCVFSFAAKNSTNPDIFKILGANLRMDIGGLHHLFLTGDIHNASSMGSMPCSCCGERLRPRQIEQSFAEDKSVGNITLESRVREKSIQVRYASEHPSKTTFNGYVDSSHLIPKQHNAINSRQVMPLALETVVLPELIQLDETPSPSMGHGISRGESMDDKFEFHAAEDFNPTVECDLMNFDCSPTSVDESSAKYDMGTNQIENLSIDHRNEASYMKRESSLENERSVQYNDHGDESHTFRKSISIASSLESLDICYLSDIEGESFVDRLKRQVERDRECIISLYKEFEKERNASAVAADEAMAMITRLQEEKAALHMEALQYLRMMEEQAQYDVEALEKANDLLAEKEKEIQDMEAELESCRFNLPEETLQDSHEVISEWKGESLKAELPLNETTLEFDFDEDRLYILGCLESLEAKLCQISQSGNLLGEVDSPLSEEEISVHDETEKWDPSIAREGSDIVVAIEQEIADLNARLEALECSQDFIEHALNTLVNGNEGARFIREVAHQLKELRRLGVELTTHSTVPELDHDTNGNMEMGLL